MSQFGVLIQPNNCSKCKEVLDSGDRRFLRCGCCLCTTCATSKKLRTMITCPTCLYQYNLNSGDVVGYYHENLTVGDVDAQNRRCQFYRLQLASVEDQVNEVSESDPLSGDLDFPPHLTNPVCLSDSSLEISSSASDITDEYRNTQYALVASRLAKLIAKKNQTTQRLQAKSNRVRERKAKAKPPKASDEERMAMIATEKLSRRKQRNMLTQNRRLRLLAHHGAQLDEVKQVKKKKVAKDDDEEEEPEPEPDDDDEEGKKKDPNSIEEVRLLFTTDKGYFVKLNYLQRWRLKIDEWKQWKLSFAEKQALLEERVSDATRQEDNERDPAKGARRVAVLRHRLSELKRQDEAVTNKIDDRIAKLEAREKLVPGKTVMTRKLASTKAERLYLLGQFYPERLPKVEEKKEDDDDD